MQQVGSALGTVDAKLKTTETELREVQKQLKFDPSNTELLAQKQDLLGKRIADSRTKLETLNSILEQHTAKMKAAGTVTEEMETEHRALVREIEKTKNQIQNFGEQMSGIVSVTERETKAISEIDDELRVLDSEMKRTSAQFSDSEDKLAALTAETEQYEKKADKQREKIAHMTSALEDAKNQYGEGSKEVKNWIVKLNEAETALIGTERAIKGNREQMSGMTREVPLLERVGNAFDAWREKSEKAKDKMTGITGLKKDYKKLQDAVEVCKEKHFVLFGALDKVKAGMHKVGDAAKKAASVGFEALKTGAKATGAALVAVSGAAIKLGKDVVESYGELEQNLGGSEAVFGEYASKIQKIGEDAYKNLGVTQSEYLATANKMGALFQGSGLSQQESLDMTEKAMQRAADMASVMGIETSAALEAVTGAAKGNYTMMDNLGVKMDATTLAAYAVSKGMTTAYKDMSNTEKTELAMQYFFENTKQYAGNFARESSETISGSIGMLKASAQSLLAGLGNADADIQNLAGNVIESFGLVAKNVSPVIQNIADGLPALAETVVKALDGDLLPTVMNCFTSLVQSLSKTAPKIIITLADGLLDNADKLIDSALGIVAELTEGLLSPENLKKLLFTAMSLVVKLSGYLVDNIDNIIDAAFTMIDTLVESLLEEDNLEKLIHAAFDIVVNIAGGLIENLPELIRAAWDLCVALVDAIIHYDWLSVGKEIFNSIKDSIANFFTGGSSGGGSGYDGSHANGLAFVPYDGYIAQLHYGERVLTKEENEAYKGGCGVSVTLSIGEFHNYRQEDINHLADEISEVLAAKMQRKQEAFA